MQAQERISPRQYVKDLANVDVGRDGKGFCPFHPDHNKPNLHAYDEPERGWVCYASGHGGTIYDFAGLLLGLESRQLRGADYERVWRHVRTFYGLATEEAA